MPSARPSLSSRVAGFFALDDDWQRPSPPIGAGDLALAACFALFGILSLEFVRSVTDLEVGGQPVWVQWLAVLSSAALLIWRRTHPLLIGLLAALHMFVVGVTMPGVMGQFSLQVLYFSAIYSAVAWAASRRTAILVAGGVSVFMLLWIAWQLALGSGIQEIVDGTRDIESQGAFDPIFAGVALTFVINIVYFGGAIVIGQVAWRGARQRARLEEQAETIAAQADSLQRRAVVDERLRIARELHDVVGHHVSVIGVQAAAARRVLDRRPDEAASALAHIETSSRDAVTQMRSLLGTLREIEDEAEAGARPAGAMGTQGRSPDRRPEPTLSDLADLVAERDTGSLRTAYHLIESREGAHAEIAAPIGLSLYRIVQEALANISRHSTASAADVFTRVVTEGAGSPYAEVEVLDNGRPRAGTSGSGLGQLGMRERAASHHGIVDIGPRPTGGYRVRVRIPLGEIDIAGV
ncbi:sensor histidine kinase [Knoellia subterranea]|uniref:histidine kinase n=1 Tax=Knoellia subterranea KCTC 19937 TaxID=1385521 RepID=A0A0A0JJ86_9MICO|nr:histidine kinase [Knoellia subterranea]KGN37148.1 histidine kinase [Knoellia subterranea KCTC 19937]